MLSEDIQQYLSDSFQIDGDVLDLRVYDGYLATEICRFLQSHNINKHFYGVDTFNGLPTKNKEDEKYKFPNDIKQGQFFVSEDVCRRTFRDKQIPESQYTLIKANAKDFKTALENKVFSFVILDLKQFLPTTLALDFLWKSMNYGGSVYISNYDSESTSAANKAITNFISKISPSNICVSRQMMQDGKKESKLVIKLYNPANKRSIDIQPQQEKVSICLYYKSGGIYTPTYVNNLVNQIRKYVSLDYELICLTNDFHDLSSNIDRVEPTIHNFPTWWGKIELFRTGLFKTKRMFYLDLDTIIKCNIDDVLQLSDNFIGLRDFYKLYSLGSGLMFFNTELYSSVYEKFLLKSESIIKDTPRGDQVWINSIIKHPSFFQDYFQKEIVSYKVHCLHQNQIVIPESAKIICFHGNPRIHQIENPTVQRLWNVK